MNMQNQILNKYFEVFGANLTLKEISTHVGMQITRVFRILNGYEMRVTEYEKFKTKINESNPGFQDALVESALEGEKVFSLKAAKEIKRMLDLKIRLHQTVAQ